MNPKQLKKNYPQGNLHYTQLPKQLTRKEFNQFIAPHLSHGTRGPKPKISYYKIFNYILYVLHTGIQWKELRPSRKEISWQSIYHHHSIWSKDGSYKNLFLTSVMELDDWGKLDTSILHGDGSNTVAKKGVQGLDIQDINIRRAKKQWKYAMI